MQAAGFSIYFPYKIFVDLFWPNSKFFDTNIMLCVGIIQFEVLDANAFREGELMTRGLFWALGKMEGTEVADRVTFERLRRQCQRASGLLSGRPSWVG